MTTLIENTGLNRDPAKKEFALQLSALNEKYEKMTPFEILEDAFERSLFGSAAVVSSFGAESAVLLHMVSEIAPGSPVLLIDTGKLFGETLQYATLLQHRLGLEDVRRIHPKRSDVERLDPIGKLSGNDPDRCCQLRKTDVLDRALKPFQTWINGRKRFQSDQRSSLSIVERDSERLKLTPLANWNANDITSYIRDHKLPAHPLLAKGYSSIGCFPCTSKVESGADPRSGRWNGIDKTECGLHT